MGDVSERAELPFEAVQRGGSEPVQRLERDVAALPVIVGAVDHSHAARAELREQPETVVSREVFVPHLEILALGGWGQDRRHDIPGVEWSVKA